MHLPELIHDLALILATAGAVSLLFKWLKQPVVLGYLLAGVLVGPQVSVLPNVGETESLQVWAELGVIFLLFVLGLEFSFRKLLEVGKTAFIAAAFEVAFMTLAGYLTGTLLGWDSMDSLFLGGMLAISSTAIIVKAFEELGIKTQSFAVLVFGILVIEDIFAILLLALLSTIGATQKLEGIELLKQVGFLSAFLIVAIPLGLWLIPLFFKKIRGLLNDESRVIIFLGLCLGSVVLCNLAGFSPALGAFLIGAIMGETAEGERAERLLKPIRDLFAAVFFTSVGMLVDLKVATNHLPLIALISVITVIGKILSTGFGAFLAKQDVKTSIQAGLSLAQIGEFSFIIATLGLSLGVIKPDLYPIVVLVSMVTTFLTPYLIKWGAQSRLLANRAAYQSQKTQRRLWDGHLVEFEVHPHFLHLNTPLGVLNLRQKFGVSVLALLRGDRKILSPESQDVLMPFDRAIIFGTDDQLAQVEKFLRSERHDFDADHAARFRVERVLIRSQHPTVGKNLKESGIRETFNGIVLGIERGEEKILNPESHTVLLSGDLIWIYGDREQMKIWEKKLG